MTAVPVDPELEPRHRVVVLDREASVQRAFTYLLSRLGYEVGTCECGEDGVAAEVGEECDTILTCVGPEGKSGLEVLCEADSEVSASVVATVGAVTDVPADHAAQVAMLIVATIQVCGDQDALIRTGRGSAQAFLLSRNSRAAKCR